jgi:hypothetical protein
MKKRHLNPVIKNALVVIAAVVIASVMLYGMFTCRPVNYPELW